MGSYLDTLAEVLFQDVDSGAAFAAIRGAIRDDSEKVAFRERMERICAALPAVEKSKSVIDEHPTLDGGDSGLSPVGRHGHDAIALW